MMASYKIEIKRSVKRDLRQLPKSDILKILNAIESLASQPQPPQSKKLVGLDRYRLKCGKHRVLYEIRDHVLLIIVVKVRHRKNAYR